MGTIADARLNCFPARNTPRKKLSHPGDPMVFTDKEGRRTVGFCLWCNRDFYSMEEVYKHNHEKPCPEVREAMRAARDA